MNKREISDSKLWESMRSLMQKKNIDEISTSELLEQSGISRSTFYRQYHDKYDFLNKNYQQLLNETLCQVPEGMSYRTAFFKLYGVLQTDPFFYKNALASQDYNGLRNYIYQQSYQILSTILEEHNISMKDRQNELLLRGFLSAALELTCDWAGNGMKEPLDLLFLISYQLMPEPLKTIISVYYM